VAVAEKRDATILGASGLAGETMAELLHGRALALGVGDGDG